VFGKEIIFSPINIYALKLTQKKKKKTINIYVLFSPINIYVFLGRVYVFGRDNISHQHYVIGDPKITVTSLRDYHILM